MRTFRRKVSSLADIARKAFRIIIPYILSVNIFVASSASAKRSSILLSQAHGKEIGIEIII